MENKIIVMGDGLLGSEIVKQTGWDYISRKKDKIEFTAPYTYLRFLAGYNIIVNCIANTDTYSDDMLTMWHENFLGVMKLSKYCNENDKKLVHISTDYVYSGSVSFAKETDVPVHARNWYSLTKLLADSYIQATILEKNYLILRASFKPTPFPYPKAFTTIRGSFDYVDIIADLIIKLINKNAYGVFNVGTDEKTMYDLAKRTNPNVEPIEGEIHSSMPRDVTMDIRKMKEVLNEI